MKTKSPAPWKIGTARGQENYIFDANGVAVVQAVNPEDLNLIACAPELLKALEPFAAWLKHPSVPIIAAIRPEEWDRVTTAYNKATGRFTYEN